jgi:hypothetical protein
VYMTRACTSTLTLVPSSAGPALLVAVGCVVGHYSMDAWRRGAGVHAGRDEHALDFIKLRGRHILARSLQARGERSERGADRAPTCAVCLLSGRERAQQRLYARPRRARTEDGGRTKPRAPRARVQSRTSTRERARDGSGRDVERGVLVTPCRRVRVRFERPAQVEVGAALRVRNVVSARARSAGCGFRGD